MIEEHWYIVDGFPTREAAETLARVIRDGGIDAGVPKPPAEYRGHYCVMAPNDKEAQVDALLGWTAAAEFDDMISAEVTAGRLVTEGIPANMEGPKILRQTDVKSRVWVPRACLDEARKILSGPLISDDELTDLALGAGRGGTKGRKTK